MVKTPIKIQIVKTLADVKPSRIVAVKNDGDTTFSLYITDKQGTPFPIKDNSGTVVITNTDGNLDINGTEINISSALLSTINSALQSGDNISELVNDVGYLTTFTETDPIFQASEASLFVAGDKANLDNQSNINSGDETTSSIQTKRPLKTINGESLEGSGNVQIDYNDLDNLPTIPTILTQHSELTLDDGTNPHGTTKSDLGLSNVDNTSDIDKPISTATQTALDLKENVANKSTNIITDQASNVKYPSVKSVFDYIQPEFNIRLKGYAFDSFSEFPTSIEPDAFYIDRESGDVYIGWLDPNYFGDPALGGLYYKKIGLNLGETSSTAYRGDRGKIAYDHSQTTGNPHGTTKNEIGLGNVDNTSDLNKPISTVTQNALNTKLDKSSTPSSVYTTDVQGLQVMKPISEFQPVGDYVTINTTQTVTGNKTFDDVGLIKKVNTANLYPNQSGGSFAIGGDGGYDRFEFYSLDGTDQNSFGSVQIYSYPERGNAIYHISLDNEDASYLNVNYFDLSLINLYAGQRTALNVDAQNGKIKIEGTTNKFATLGTSLITGTKNFEFPNQSGTLALLSDLTDTQTALNLKLPIESPSTTGTVISFTVDKVYGTLTTPETGNITADVTNAKLGVTNIIIHNSGTAPTFDSKFKKLSGSGNYVTGVVNYIYCTFITSTEIIYSINQRS